MSQTQRLILGPPGTGKTTKLISLVEEEFTAGTRPNKILYSTFTKRGANEAIVRSCEKFGFKRSDIPYFRTLHSLAFQELHVSREDVMQLRDYKRIGTALGIDFGWVDLEDGMPTPSANVGDNMLYLLGLSRSRMVSPEEQFKDSDFDFTWFEFDRFIRTLNEYKNKNGLLDFSDMIDLYIKEGNPINIEVAIIDEAQDLSKQQWAMANRAMEKAQRIYIGGDDDQCIYTWSGADINHFLSLPGKKTVLQHSYRLPKAVFQLAEKINGRVKRRYPKKWAPRPEEGSVDYIHSLDDLDIRPGTNLLLARNKFMLAKYETILRREGFPYTNSRGSSIDLECVSAIRTWEALRRGEKVDVALVRLALAYLKIGVGIKVGKRTLKGATGEIGMDELVAKWGLLTTDIWHDAFLNMDDVAYYLAVLRRGEKLTKEPRIHISTIHAVKGGEADNVILLTDVSWKTFQSYRERPDDEHRVFYVGVTRARNTLQIILPQTNIFYDMP